MTSLLARWTMLVAAAVALLAGSARAADQPIAGTKLLLQRTNGKEKLVFVAKDATLVLPAIGSADDPTRNTPGGLTVELFSPVQVGGALLVVPPGASAGWTARPTPILTYRYDVGSAAGIRHVVLQQGKQVRITGAQAGLALAGPQGAVGIRLTLGSRRLCAFFGPDTIVRDEAGRFVAKNASAAALGDCSNVSGVPPACGDGVVNQSTEACDTATLADCAPAGGCIPAGSPNECQCCYADAVACGGPLFPNYPCCGGETCVPVSSAGTFTDVCAKLTCGPGDACTQGASCQNGGCCIGEGTTCGHVYYGGLAWDASPFPCCSGTSCAPTGPAVNGVLTLTCQTVAGRPCTTSSECFPLQCIAGVCG